MILGIDLGMMNSLVVVFCDGKLEFVFNVFGDFLMLFVVSFDSGGEVFVGVVV